MWRSSHLGTELASTPVTEATTVRPAVLVSAGTDSSGGAGLTRDVRVLTDFDIDVICVITAVTAQSNSQVTAIHHVPPEVIRAQIVAAFETRPVGAIKIGMLGTRTTVEAVVENLAPRTRAPRCLCPRLYAPSADLLSWPSRLPPHRDTAC